MSERVYYVICGDNCKFEGMTKEQIYDAIAEATGATPTGVDDAFITQIKEQNAQGMLKFWKGTEAQFNAISPAPTTSLFVGKLGTDGKIYVLSDDTTISDLEDDIEENADAIEAHANSTEAHRNAFAAKSYGNMLINADFCNLQEIGGSSASGTVTKLLGWHIPAVTVSYSNADGISFNPGGSSAVLWQQRKFLNGMGGKKFTFSAAVGGAVSAIALSVEWFDYNSTQLAWTSTDGSDTGVKWISGTVPDGACYARFKITCTGNASVTIKRAKAEMCEYSTISGDQPLAQIPFVIETGTSGIWTYRKWSDGTAECWGTYTGTKDITTALGTWYDCIFDVNYPFTFSTAPVVTVDGGSNDAANFARVFNTAPLDKASIILYAPASQSQKSVHVSIYAIGKI